MINLFYKAALYFSIVLSEERIPFFNFHFGQVTKWGINQKNDNTEDLENQHKVQGLANHVNLIVPFNSPIPPFLHPATFSIISSVERSIRKRDIITCTSISVRLGGNVTGVLTIWYRAKSLVQINSTTVNKYTASY